MFDGLRSIGCSKYDFIIFGKCLYVCACKESVDLEEFNEILYSLSPWHKLVPINY